MVLGGLSVPLKTNEYIKELQVSQCHLQWDLSFYFLIFFNMDFSKRFFFLQFYLFEREAELGEGKEMERESQADSPLSREPDEGLRLMALRSCPDSKQFFSQINK